MGMGIFRLKSRVGLVIAEHGNNPAEKEHHLNSLKECGGYSWTGAVSSVLVHL